MPPVCRHPSDIARLVFSPACNIAGAREISSFASRYFSPCDPALRKCVFHHHLQRETFCASRRGTLLAVQNSWILHTATRATPENSRPFTAHSSAKLEQFTFVSARKLRLSGR